MYKKIETKLGNRDITIETGRLAKQADGAVIVSYGETKVLVTAVSSREEKEGLDFFPLTVDYVEKYYSAGKVPGGYLKREAKPTDHATLTSRIIDRPIRPLFPKTYKNETQVIATVLSYDPDFGSDEVSLIGASAALMISDIPFNGPIAACRVAKVDEKLIASPTAEELENSTLDILVAASKDAVVMVEGEVKLLPEEEVLEAIMFAKDSMQDVINAQIKLQKECGKEKRQVKEELLDKELEKQVEEKTLDKIKKAFKVKEKLERYKALSEIKEDLKEIFNTYKETENFKKLYNEKEILLKTKISEIFSELKHKHAKNLTLKENTRIDGRDFKEVRPIECITTLLPRVHGSSVFTRGETQVLAAVTLAGEDDEQFIDSIAGLVKDKFMLHYNFPPFSVGEAKGLRGPGRREIGHGTLAKRGIKAVLPNHEEFPYTIRVVSEVLESNGSSSMGTVCSGCMALMDAGVPIKETVAGIAMGLIADEENDKFVVLTDILGDEDHLGDMDFKVVGTRSGISAIQMDIKIAGVTKEILETALNQARDGRIHIIEEMEKEIKEPRESVSKYAPRIETVQIDKEFVRDIIGPKGKVIKSIIEKTGTKININDDGIVSIASNDLEKIKEAKQIVLGIAGNPEEGTVFEAEVKKIMDFGAFVEYLPGKEGLVHVSEIAKERVENVKDYLNEGDKCKVKYLGKDDRGRVKLSIKALKD
jgi:polyribonucleotide nucleotidyltransferase